MPVTCTASVTSKEPMPSKRQNAKMQNFGECLDKLDQYDPSRVIAGRGFRRSGNRGVDAFQRYLERSFGPVELCVPVVYLFGDAAEPPQVSNCVFFVMSSSRDARRVLATETHTLEDGIGIKVRQFVGKTFEL